MSTTPPIGFIHSSCFMRVFHSLPSSLRVNGFLLAGIHKPLKRWPLWRRSKTFGSALCVLGEVVMMIATPKVGSHGDKLKGELSKVWGYLAGGNPLASSHLKISIP